MEFSRQEYWTGYPFLSPDDLPNPGIGPRSLTLQADSLPSEPPGKPIYTHNAYIIVKDREARHAVVHRVAKSQTGLSD